MAFPKTVTKGEAMTASWANSVVQVLKDTVGDDSSNNRTPRKLFHPFCPIRLCHKADGWYIKLQEGLYYEKHKTSPTDILWGTTALSDYPEIKITPDKDLYFNFKTKKLQWDDKEICGANLKILDFTYDGEKFTIEETHPRHIDLRHAPPFTPLFSKEEGASNYSVALTHGYVSERTPEGTGGITNWLPTDLAISGELVHHTINSYQQIAVNVQTSNLGAIDYPPSLVIETVDTATTHYHPPCADSAGNDGDYHFAMAARDNNGLNHKLCGSHIDYCRDIPYIDNLSNITGADMARPVKEYDLASNKFIFRNLKKKYGSQLSVTESDNMEIGGNGVAGGISVRVGNAGATSLTMWEDGLMTGTGGTIVIPRLIAGSGIVITDNEDGTFTISHR